MTIFKRDTHHHTYADYLAWSRNYGDELLMVPPTSGSLRARHGLTRRLSVSSVARRPLRSKASPAAYTSRHLTSVCPSRPKRTTKSTPWCSPTFSSFPTLRRLTHAVCAALQTGWRRSVAEYRPSRPDR